MSRKDRDLQAVEQVIDKLRRTAKSNRAQMLSDRLASLGILFSVVTKTFHKNEQIPKADEVVDEVYRYIPIALVTLMEGYFKQAIQDLIDFQPKCRERVDQFTKLEFGPKSVLAIYGRDISLGAFIAHHLSINRLEDIDAHMSTVLGEQFMKVVKVQFADKVTFEEIQKTFELRHQLVHELAPTVDLDMMSVISKMVSVSQFLKGSEALVADRAGPDPKTRSGLMTRARLLAETLNEQTKREPD